MQLKILTVLARLHGLALVASLLALSAPALCASHASGALPATLGGGFVPEDPKQLRNVTAARKAALALWKAAAGCFDKGAKNLGGGKADGVEACLDAPKKGAVAKYAKTIAKLAGKPPGLPACHDYAAEAAEIVRQLEGRNARVLCADGVELPAIFGGGELPGDAALRKNVLKAGALGVQLFAKVWACHDSAIAAHARGKSFDLGACLTDAKKGALAKHLAKIAKLDAKAPGLPDCYDAAATANHLRALARRRVPFFFCSPPAAAEIGPAGGSLVSADGILRIEVPAGAVGAPTTFSVARATDAPDGAIGPAFELNPAGAAFAAPVRITLRYDASVLDDIVLALLRVATFAGGSWGALDGAALDETAAAVSASTTHFSVVGLAEIGGGIPCVPPLSQGCALRRVINDGWKVDAERKLSNVHRWNDPVPAGAVLDESLVPAPAAIPVAEESWLFYVDREPGAGFQHPTVFLLVGRAAGTVEAYGRNGPPRVDGITLFSTPGELLHPGLRMPGFVYFDLARRATFAGLILRLSGARLAPTATEPDPVPIPAPDPIDGLAPDPDEIEAVLPRYEPEKNETEERFRERVRGHLEELQSQAVIDTQFARCQCSGGTPKKIALLIDGGGFEEGQAAPLAAYLRSQGFDTQHLAPDHPDVLGVANARTTLPNLAKAFANVAAAVKGCCDEVLIVLNGHGSPDGQFLANPRLTIRTTDAAGNVVSTRITGDPNGGFLGTQTLKGYLDAIRSCRTTVLIDACHSGAHLERGLNAITQADAPGCLCRTVAASSSARQYSYGGALAEFTAALSAGRSLHDAYGALRDLMTPTQHTDRLHQQTPQVQSTAATLCEDADMDGLPTGEELVDGFSDPSKRDTDNDGLPDGEEKSRMTMPRVEDTDGDGLKDGEEVMLGTDPRARDTDRDGLEDRAETFLTTDPLKRDTDMGGIGDGAEVIVLGTNPKDPLDDVGMVSGFDDPPLPGADSWRVVNPDTAHTDGPFALPGAPNPQGLPVRHPVTGLPGGAVWAGPDVCPYDHLHGFFAGHADPAPGPPATESACGHGVLVYLMLAG